MFLAAGDPASAAAALDRADGFLDTHGQRYAEGLLLRARTLAAAGEPAPVVRAAADRARRLSAERGAHLFADRAAVFLAAPLVPGAPGRRAWCSYARPVS
ncbi:hypothetical protein AB0K00_25700 [Dactylosporangium sp. NPDC049525]|uniref:hypothetical protein n=1 Tax=Dactylosporangium sp. NPDC049525 TaxID=3154730 RepID=UPI0034420386